MPGRNMIDWLTSKLGTLIAIGVVTGFILALFSWQHGLMVDREGQSIADDIGGLIDSQAGLDAIALRSIAFGSGAGELPPALDGEEYHINITSSMVIVSTGNRQWSSGLSEPVICRNLTDRSLNLTEHEGLEYGHLNIVSGEDFIIERGMLDISGKIKFVTLIYKYSI